MQADDFGMCHAVNEGVVRAFTEGIVQQASLMAPCPWFDEAASLAAEHGIPVGLHETLTCEWDHLRWRPLTDGPSLRRSADGTMRKTVASVIEMVTDDDATAELIAQAERVLATGLELGYLDVHMGMSKPVAYQTLATNFGLPFLYPDRLPQSLPFASAWQMSEYDRETKRATFFRRLERIATDDGVHLIFGHPGVASPELRSIARPEAHNYRWAEEYRVSDLELLCDPEVRARIDDLGIELVSAADAFGG